MTVVASGSVEQFDRRVVVDDVGFVNGWTALGFVITKGGRESNMFAVILATCYDHKLLARL